MFLVFALASFFHSPLHRSASRSTPLAYTDTRLLQCGLPIAFFFFVISRRTMTKRLFDSTMMTWDLKEDSTVKTVPMPLRTGFLV
jgi:hypothetical protein